jgi:hypothetical protein
MEDVFEPLSEEEKTDIIEYLDLLKSRDPTIPNNIPSKVLVWMLHVVRQYRPSQWLCPQHNIINCKITEPWTHFYCRCPGCPGTKCKCNDTHKEEQEQSEAFRPFDPDLPVFDLAIMLLRDYMSQCTNYFEHLKVFASAAILVAYKQVADNSSDGYLLDTLAAECETPRNFSIKPKSALFKTAAHIQQTFNLAKKTMEQKEGVLAEQMQNATRIYNQINVRRTMLKTAERDLLDTIKWRVHPTTASEFLNHELLLFQEMIPRNTLEAIRKAAESHLSYMLCIPNIPFSPMNLAIAVRSYTLAHDPRWSQYIDMSDITVKHNLEFMDELLEANIDVWVDFQACFATYSPVQLYPAPYQHRTLYELSNYEIDFDYIASLLVRFVAK